MQHYKNGVQVDSTRLSGGKAFPSIDSDAARKNLLYYMTFRQFGQLLTFQGYPGDFLNASTNINGGFVNDFYVIFPVVKPTSGDKIRIGVEATHWDYTQPASEGAEIDAAWDGVASGNVPNDASSFSTVQRGDVSEPPAGVTIRDSALIDYDNNQSGNFGYTKFSYNLLCPAAVKFFTMPLTFTEFEALDPNWSAQQRYISDSAMNIGQTVRGCDTTDDTNGSMGEMCQAQGTNEADSNIVGSSAPCLFQSGHPSGRFIQSTSGTQEYLDMFKVPILVKPRGLKGGNSTAIVYAVLCGDSGAKIRITNGTAGVSEVTLSTTYTTPTLVQVGSVSVNAASDSLTFEAYVSSTVGLEIQTIAVFEEA